MRYLIPFFLIVLLFNACSSVKVIDAWRSEKINAVKNNQILVIARADNQLARISFEEEIAKQARASGLNAVESYKKFPSHKPDEKLSEQQVQQLKKEIKDAGYQGVVVTVLKDLQTTTRVTEDGGYSTGGYTGGPYNSYYPGYYGGFYGYYGNAMSYATYGNYVPTTITTQTSKTYILETVVYDLSLPEADELVAVVTSKMDNPQHVASTAKQYAKAVAKALSK
jgi:hypothetical protein